jgi:hypothetical protein
MQKQIDSRIQAQVRILLTRRWVDLRGITIGTVNGVVYIGGTLRRTGARTEEAAASPDSGQAWVARIQREIASIPDVRDVVFQSGQRTEDPWRQPA